MTVFEYDNYKVYVNDWVKALPNQGYGTYSKIADALGTNSVVMSQVFRADRDLNLEQAVNLTQFLGLATLEADYFVLLVQLARSGSLELRNMIQRQLGELRSRGQAIKNRISHQQLSDEDKAVFYSQWYYIAIWLAAVIPEFSTTAKLAAHLELPKDVVVDVLRFLIDRGLLVQQGGDYQFGKNVIHVPHDSPHVGRHHVNWRLKALQSMDKNRSGNLFYTAPLSLSDALAEKIREQLLQFIQTQTKKVSESPSETLRCLNIDWFEY